MRTAVRFRPSPRARRAFRSANICPASHSGRDRLAVIRSMSTREGDHGRARDNLRTGYLPQSPIEFPVLGSLVSKECDRPAGDLPNYVSILLAGLFGAGSPPGRLSRSRLCPALGRARERRHGRAAATDASKISRCRRVFRRRQARARLALLHRAEEGFLEPPARFGRERTSQCVRQGVAPDESARRPRCSTWPTSRPAFSDRYGRSQFGQGCLLARRLIEKERPLRGSVARRLGHARGQLQPRAVALSGVLDKAWSALMQDLQGSRPARLDA